MSSLVKEWDPMQDTTSNQPPQRTALKRMTGDVGALVEAPLVRLSPAGSAHSPHCAAHF